MGENEENKPAETLPTYEESVQAQSTQKTQNEQPPAYR